MNLHKKFALGFAALGLFCLVGVIPPALCLAGNNLPLLCSTPIPPPTPGEAIQQFRAQGHFTVGVRADAPPFGAASSSENFPLEGFDIDLVHEFARRWLGEHDSLDKVRFVIVSASERIPILEDREVDLLVAAMGYTAERCRRVDCSQTYVIDGARLLVHAEAQINGVCDLDGKVVSVLAGTTAQGYMETELKRLCTYKSYPQIKIYADRRDAIDAVRTGAVDAYTTDGVILEQYAGDELRVVGNEFAREDFRLAVSKKNEGLLALINLTLQAMKEDGTYDHLYEKWFGCRNAPFPLKRDPSLPKPTFVKRTVAPYTSQCTDRNDNRNIVEYIVQADETLASIALNHYGESTMAHCIQTANGLAEAASIVSAGTVLRLLPINLCVETE